MFQGVLEVVAVSLEGHLHLRETYTVQASLRSSGLRKISGFPHVSSMTASSTMPRLMLNVLLYRDVAALKSFRI